MLLHSDDPGRNLGVIETDMTYRMGPPESATPVHAWSPPIEFPLLFSA